MKRTDHPLDPSPETLLQGGVLTPAVRRDLSDLNRQFLELGLAPELASDPRFRWSDAVRTGLAGTDAATRDRMAGCPFALFEIVLPVGQPPTGLAVSRVEDGLAAAGSGEPWRGRCLAFVHFALFVAWRLADTAPLATRIALGLAPGAELQLNQMCPSEVLRLAEIPSLIRPRWPAHPRFWAMLRGAARANSAASLRWTHCVGICLLGADLSEATGAASSSQGHRPLR
jgi:hypothetical protein